MFLVIPSIPVGAGRIIPAYAIHPHSAVPQGNPLAVARYWIAAGVPMVHIEELSPNQAPTAPALVWSCHGKKTQLQVGGGIRGPQSARSFLRAGAQNFVIRSALHDRTRLTRIVEVIAPERLCSAWTLTDLAKPLEDPALAWSLGIRRCLISGAFGQLPLAQEALRTLHAFLDLGWQVWIAGGIRDAKTVQYYKDLGAQGVVIGKAFYDGTLRWEEVAPWVETEESSAPGP